MDLVFFGSQLSDGRDDSSRASLNVHTRPIIRNHSTFSCLHDFKWVQKRIIRAVAPMSLASAVCIIKIWEALAWSKSIALLSIHIGFCSDWDLSLLIGKVQEIFRHESPRCFHRLNVISLRPQPMLKNPRDVRKNEPCKILIRFWSTLCVYLYVLAFYFYSCVL